MALLLVLTLRKLSCLLRSRLPRWVFPLESEPQSYAACCQSPPFPELCASLRGPREGHLPARGPAHLAAVSEDLEASPPFGLTEGQRPQDSVTMP